MADKSGIEWTDATWNPIRGCSRVSEGCRNCYAEKVAYRFSDVGQAYHGLVGIGGKWNGQIKFVEDHLLDPLKWKKPRRIFVNSMSDLFHENVTDEWLDKIFAVMALCPQHTFQVLTKRPERMLAYSTRPDHYFRIKLAAEQIQRARKMEIDRSAHRSPSFIANVQLGVSVENQDAANRRIPLLLQTPATVRFISAEPLLGPVDLVEMPSRYDGSNRPLLRLNAFTGEHECGRQAFGPTWGRLDWVICGGESGPGARPMHPDWARGLRDQCVAAGVPFFFKQWGEWAPAPRQWVNDALSPIMVRSGDVFLTQAGDFDVLDADLRSSYESSGTPLRRVGKKAAGALLDGREWREFPVV